MEGTIFGIDTVTFIAAAAAVVLILIVMGVVLDRRGRRVRLKERFGPEYERVLLEEGDIRHAESVLAARQKRVAKYAICPLKRADRDRYAQEWTAVQQQFVDDPGLAVDEAESLVTMVMAARGYPMANFDERAADLSVHYPRVVHQYRRARLIAVRHEQEQATTEELRQAMVYYRSLFEELLETPRPDTRDFRRERLAS